MTWFLVKGYPVGGWDFGSHPGNELPGWSPGKPVDPGWGGGWGGGGRPDNSLPWGPGHPGNRPPGSWSPVDPGWGTGGGRPDNSLPWGPGHPGNALPGQPIDPGWGGGIGSGNYPSGQPIVPGATPMGSAVATAPPEKVDAEHGVWVLVSVQGSLVWAWAQKPKAPNTPDAGLPTPPPTATPKR